jgi:hypothetical protein
MGLRPIEVSNLIWDSIDLAKALIHVPRTMVRAAHPAPRAIHRPQSMLKANDVKGEEKPGRR